MNIRTTAAAVACAGLTLLAAAGPATADSNGATVTKFSGCQSSYGITECGTVQSEGNITTTPSGNTSIEDNGRYDYTLSFYGLSFTETGYFHNHQLFKAGETQVFSDHFSNTSTDVYGTCTYSGDLHYANGQWQFDNVTLVCS